VAGNGCEEDAGKLRPGVSTHGRRRPYWNGWNIIALIGFLIRTRRRSSVSPRQPHEPEERKSNQVLAKIQHSEASHDEEAPKDHAALVADPKKRLVDGAVDPVTQERKPAD